MSNADAIDTLDRAIGALRRGDLAAAARLAGLLDPAAAPPSALAALTELWRQLGALDRAERAGRLAVARAPGAAAWNNLGLVLQQRQRPEAAAAAFAAALRLDPDHARAGYNQARLSLQSGDLTAAETRLRALLDRHPDYLNAWVALALVARHRDREAVAADILRRVLARDPGHRGARVQWASLRARQPGGAPEAEAALRQALAEQPRDALAWHALGQVCEQQQRWTAALAAYDAGLAADPGHAGLLADRENVRRELCDWRDWPRPLARLRRLSRRALAAGQPAPLPPMTSCRVPVPPALQRALAARHAQGIGDASGPPVPWLRSAPAAPPLRVGWLAHEFHYNVVGRLLAALLPAFDRARVTTVGLACNPERGDPFRARLAARCDEFIDLSALDDAAAAARIASAGLHLLIDVNPYLTGGRPGIAARRPAPIQVSYLSPITSGAPWIDYFIADPVAAPPGAESHFSECLVRLPPSYLPSAGPEPIAAVPPARAALGLPAGARVLASFNRQDKLLPAVFGCWLALLRAHPDTVLWLTAGPDAARANLRAWAAERGVAPERLIFAEHEPDMSRHLARLQHAELMLDSFPHTAHVTAADVLWAGVPLLTRAGPTFASRVAASLLTAAGLPELIAVSADDYARRARALLARPAALDALRQRLWRNRAHAALFQPAVLAGRLTDAWETLWARHLAGAAPAALDLDYGPDPGLADCPPVAI